MEVLIGPKGGKYYLDENGKKHYIKVGSKKVSTELSSRERILKQERTRHCCCCGKELKRSECEYYDLTNYCPKCALADGIITSLD